MTLLVRHAMTPEPKALSTDRSAADAAGLMAQFDIGSVPVVDEDAVVGIVTDRDLVVRVIAKRRDPSDVRLDEILTKVVETISPDAELSDARTQMEHARVRRLPVVKDDRLVKHIPFINTIRRHHISHHNTSIMMEKNFNLTYPIADWFFGTSDLRCGLLQHVFNGYGTRFVRDDLKRVRNTSDDVRAGHVRAAAE